MKIKINLTLCNDSAAFFQRFIFIKLSQFTEELNFDSEDGISKHLIVE